MNLIKPEFRCDDMGLNFKNNSYPPKRHFQNAYNCQKFVDFINSESIERLKSGAINCLGKVGEVETPHIVSPITIEPS